MKLEIIQRIASEQPNDFQAREEAVRLIPAGKDAEYYQGVLDMVTVSATLYTDAYETVNRWIVTMYAAMAHRAAECYLQALEEKR